MIEKQRQNAFHAIKCVMGLFLKVKQKESRRQMGLNFDKHKEHLEKDIRAELQKKFGSGFEIEGIYDIVLSSYCPTFLFKINLEDYKENWIF